MPRIQLTPQRRDFYRLYSAASANAMEIARRLCRLLDDFEADGDATREIKTLEHQGDRITHEVIDLLNRTFVTPFDRDDMYRLAGALDDICDHVDEAAGDITSYGVQTVRPAARAQGHLILSCATKLHEAVGRLEGFRVDQQTLIELRELEDQGDRISREAIAELFRSENDAIELIRWKGIHEQLEEALDACENAADVLEAIIVKNR